VPKGATCAHPPMSGAFLLATSTARMLVDLRRAVRGSLRARRTFGRYANRAPSATPIGVGGAESLAKGVPYVSQSNRTHEHPVSPSPHPRCHAVARRAFRPFSDAARPARRPDVHHVVPSGPDGRRTAAQARAASAPTHAVHHWLHLPRRAGGRPLAEPAHSHPAPERPVAGGLGIRAG